MIITDNRSDYLKGHYQSHRRRHHYHFAIKFMLGVIYYDVRVFSDYVNGGVLNVAARVRPLPGLNHGP